MSSPVLEFQHVTMQYGTDKARRQVLTDVSFQLKQGSTVALVGRSGSGKSTLLHLAAGILVPTAGPGPAGRNELSSLNEQGTHRLCAAGTWAWFSSSSTCCPTFPCAKTSPCPAGWPGPTTRLPPARAQELLSPRRAGRPRHDRSASSAAARCSAWPSAGPCCARPS